MRVTNHLSTLDGRLPYPLVAIGVFDGVHLGHQLILETLRERARRFAGTTVLLSFSPHPQRIISPQNAPPLLQTSEQKQEMLAKKGIEVLVEIPFTRHLSLLTPEEFVEEHLVKHGIREIHVGSNFRFGHRRLGDFELLRKLGRHHSYKVFETPILYVRNLRVSSTHIRNFLASGKVSQASRMLGRPYEIRGTVVRGACRGRTLGFPTANLEPHNELVPAKGVYVTRANVDGAWINSVTNVGHRPTVEANSGLTIETHLLDFDENLYGRPLVLEFHCRLRGERRFSDLDELRRRIARDVNWTRRFFSDPGSRKRGHEDE